MTSCRDLAIIFIADISQDGEVCEGVINAMENNVKSSFDGNEMQLCRCTRLSLTLLCSNLARITLPLIATYNIPNIYHHGPFNNSFTVHDTSFKAIIN